MYEIACPVVKICIQLQKKARKKRQLSDSEDEIFTKKKKPSDLLNSKKKTPEQPKLKEVKVQDLFGSGPIKRTEPLVKKTKKHTETGIHSDEEFEKSLLEIDAERSSSNTKTEKSGNRNHKTTGKPDVSNNKPLIQMNLDHKSEEKKEHKREEQLKHEDSENKDKIYKDKHKESKREHKEDNRRLKTNDSRKDHKDSIQNGGSIVKKHSKTKDTDSKADHRHIEVPHKDRSRAISNAVGNQKERNIDTKKHHKTPEKIENGNPSKEKKRDFSVFLESDTSVVEDYETPKSKKKKINNSLNESGNIILN